MILSRWHLYALLLALAALRPAQAQAIARCTVDSTTPLSFGTISPSGTTDATAIVSVTCRDTAFFKTSARIRMCLTIEDGVSGGGNFNPRRMQNALSDSLQFQMYTDAARSQIWQSSAAATPLEYDLDYGLFDGYSQTRLFTIYGRIPAQAFIAGNYANAFSGIHTSLKYRYRDGGLLGYPASCTTGGEGDPGGPLRFPFTATAVVPANCRAYTTTNLDFGSVAGIITGDLDQTSSIGMICTGRTAWQMGLNNGLNAAGANRRMRLGTTLNYVSYELYRTPARNLRWGNTLNTDTLQGTGTGSAQTLTVYGRVPASQTPAPGAYGDTITVTITY
ncbi:MAG: spore coat U domain-containing protein [Luteimonas sp.]